MSVNKVILIGNVGKDPEIRHLDSGVAVANFPLATSESYTAKNGDRVSTTEWHNIVLWRGLADVAERFLKKGNQVYIEGKIKTRSYEQDGIKKFITEIFADNMTMLGKKEPGDSGDYQSTQAATPKIEEPDIEAPDDDLPF